jgi:hypothetical protein
MSKPKTFTNIRQVLERTNEGHLTIALNNEEDVRHVREKGFDIYSKLNILSLKPKRGAPTTFIQADDVQTYLALIEMVKSYKILGAKGRLSPPSSSMPAVA